MNNKKEADKEKPVSSYDIRSFLPDSRPNVIKKENNWNRFNWLMKDAYFNFYLILDSYLFSKGKNIENMNYFKYARL